MIFRLYLHQSPNTCSVYCTEVETAYRILCKTGFSSSRVRESFPPLAGLSLCYQLEGTRLAAIQVNLAI